MSDKHPYSASSHIIQVINHFRNSFPSVVDATTLKKLGYAANNESRIINILRFLNFIDEEGKKSESAKKVFSIIDDVEFSSEFKKIVKTSYSDLFDLHGDNTWNLNEEALITFFRSEDDSTSNVGKLQAKTFMVLAGYSGYGEIPELKSTTSKQTKTSTPKKGTKVSNVENDLENQAKEQNKEKNQYKDIGLTVRIEINLPADGSQETYNRIFKSIRENLLDV